MSAEHERERFDRGIAPIWVAQRMTEHQSIYASCANGHQRQLSLTSWRRRGERSYPVCLICQAERQRRRRERVIAQIEESADGHVLRRVLERLPASRAVGIAEVRALAAILGFSVRETTQQVERAGLRIDHRALFCKRGHARTPENLYYNENGASCKACQKLLRENRVIRRVAA